MKKFITLPLLLAATSTHAALIAHYDFADGDLLDDEQGTYALTEVAPGTGNVTLNPDGSAAFPGNDGANKAHLEVTGPGGAAAFTVSFWMQTSNWTQGNFQGLFSNLNINAANNFSWQIDSNGGTLRVVSATTGFTSLEVDASSFATDEWHHVVLRKVAGTTEFYVTQPGAATPTLVASNTVNPGGLQNFRLGTNRNTDSLFTMDMANVKIYNDGNIANVAALLAEGPQTIPEPSVSLLALLGGLCVFRRRR